MTPGRTFKFSAPLWLRPSVGNWHYVTVPPETSDDIAQLTAGPRQAFGAVRVTATVGGTTWQTSIFPETKAGTYDLPVKKPVRTKENLNAGDTIEVLLEIVD
jgi:hypothetical protein